MRATLKALRSKCGASVVPVSDSAIRRRSAAVAMRAPSCRYPICALRHLYAARLGLAHPGLRREPFMLNAAVRTIGTCKEHWRCMKACAIGDDPGRNGPTRLRAFDHHCSRACAHAFVHLLSRL